MKKLISILLTISLIFSFTACGSGDSAAPDVKDEPAGLTYPYNIVNRPMKAGDVYDYKSVCYSDRSLTTDGHVYIYDYLVEPAGDGMVDKTVKAMFIFDDDNAWDYGMSFDVMYADFVQDQAIDSEEDWTVTVDGKDYTVEVLQDEFVSGGWTPMSNFVSKYVLTIRMPENYDDVGLFFYNSQNKLNIAGEDTPIPDGTPINKLVDSHSQWFILGGKGADWEETKTPTYYGNPIEAQVNNIDIRDVLGGDPVFDVEEEIEDGAPPEYLEFPYIELIDWSEDVIKANGTTQVIVDFDIYNAPESAFYEITAYCDNSPKALYVDKGDAWSAEDNVVAMSAFIDIDAAEVTSESVCFEFALYDADSNLLDMTKFDIPFEGETQQTDDTESEDTVSDDTVSDDTVSEDTPKIAITEVSASEIDSSLDKQDVEFVYEIENFQGPMSVGYYVSDGEGGEPVDFFTLFDTTPDGTICIPVPASALVNDELFCRFRLLDSYDETIEEISFTIPVK